MMAEIVQPAQVDTIWPAIVGEVVRCLKKTPTDLDPGDYWSMCRNGSAWLILCHDERGIRGVSIWHFHNKAFDCLLMVGHGFAEWFPALHQTARNIAVAHNCKLRATCRPGMGRAINQFLYNSQDRVKTVRHTIEIEV